MFAKNSKAYSVYLLFRFVCSLAVSMSTVLSIVYHLEVVQLDAFQLVLVGTVLETSCFLFEMPTGVVADLYSRRRSVLIGMFLYGLGFLMEGALPWFAPVLLAQVVWGCGDTFITGALEAWIASEEEDKPIDKVFLRGSQMGQIGGVLGVVLGTLLGNINLQMPIILGGSLCLLLGLVMVRIMPETNFSPAIEERQGLLKDFVCLFKLNLGFVKGAPVLLALLAITLCGGLASEGFDRLSTAHFLDDTENTSINDGTVTANMLFFGTSTVTTVASGATFTDGKALFELVADGEGKVRILMHETRFAAEMPALEMEIPGISYSGEEKTIDLSAASVTPEIKGTPFAKYVITNLTGKADSKYLTITFTCAGAFDVNYQGRLIIEK